jgi:putative transposase
MKKSIGTINLTEDQENELLTWSRSTSLDYRLVVRAKLILLLNEGRSYDDASASLNVGKTAIAKWKRRFLEKGLTGLKDAPRPGKPCVYSKEDHARVIQKACEKPDGGYTSWSQRRIAKELNMSQSTVHKILKENELRPHKVEYWCGKSTDPEFESKMLNVIGLYMNPPENALVICVDEKTQMQALDRSQPELPIVCGKPKRQTATYKRNGTVSLIASLAVHTGEVTGTIIEQNNARNFLKFLRKIDRKYRNKHLHIIVDNLAVHKHKDVKAWLEKKRKITVHFTPTYSSWLNQVEIWFNILSKDVLKGGIWKSKEQMVKQLMEYIKTYNETRAKPFSWTYDGSKNISGNKESSH